MLRHKTTNCKFLKGLAVFLLLTFSCHLVAAPKPRYYDDQTGTSIREMRATLDDLRHEVNNHEIEIKTYEEKIGGLESIIDSLRQHSSDTATAHKDALKNSSATLEMKLNSLDTLSKGLVADLKQFKNHANETAAALAQYKTKMIELEKIVDVQNQNIDNLQNAVRSLSDLLQIKSGLTANSSVESGKKYKVVSGDSLEKIAKKNQTSIQAIKDLNGLNNDKIIVGQTLLMP